MVMKDLSDNKKDLVLIKNHTATALTSTNQMLEFSPTPNQLKDFQNYLINNYLLKYVAVKMCLVELFNEFLSLKDISDK